MIRIREIKTGRVSRAVISEWGRQRLRQICLNGKNAKRAMIAAKVKPMFETKAKERQVATQIKNGLPPEPVRANLPPAKKHKSRDDAARLFNVSPRSVETADFQERDFRTDNIRQKCCSFNFGDPEVAKKRDRPTGRIYKRFLSKYEPLRV